MTFCVLFIILGVTLAKLKVQSPIKMEDFPDILYLDYSVANFGHIPYGKRMAAQLFAPPVDPEKDKTLKLCEQAPYNMNLQFYSPSSEKWLIVRRGDCPFTRKAINAQNMKARLLIIVDNRDEKVESIMMADDGNGYQIDIPSILISKKDGEKLLEFLEKSTSRYLIGTIEFKLSQTSNKTNVLFGLNIENKDTFKLINEFRPMYLELKEHINFQIFYEVLRCLSCEANNWQTENQDCLGGGRYCQFDPNGIAFGTGSDVLREQLRQSCIWQYNTERWWSYMNYFTKKCTKANEYDQCFTQFATAEEKAAIEQCIKDSYLNQAQPEKGENTILEEYFKLRYQSGIIFYPGVSINSLAYRGNIEAEEIKEAICASFIEMPEACSEKLVIYEPNRQIEDSYFWLIVVVITISVLFILFIIFIYRRQMNQSMQKNIREQVSQQVNNYVRFYESRSEK
ncbi:unnamed protein product [Paramecium primaurelia]|uniref:PA domain-containing protein n=1 Tax=Paramecium primaurelia TaxID=5886 RepID=A0A8S1MD39_PARPR|nr:unnamed protein product [Paramecium primaurelia]